MYTYAAISLSEMFSHLVQWKANNSSRQETDKIDPVIQITSYSADNSTRHEVNDKIYRATDRTSGTRTHATQMLINKFVEMCSTPLATAPRRETTSIYCVPHQLIRNISGEKNKIYEKLYIVFRFSSFQIKKVFFLT